MTQLVLASLLRLGSIKHIFLPLILSTMFILDLSASQTDKNQFTFPHWKNLHKLNTKALESMDHNAWFDIYYQGKIQSCIKCHVQAKETDYMFSESMMENINEEERL